MRIKVSEKVWKFCGQCSNNILTVFGAFILEESANALYQGADSIYMKDIKWHSQTFPEQASGNRDDRRLKPHSLVKQIKKIQIENEYNIDFDLDSLVSRMEKQQKL